MRRLTDTDGLGESLLTSALLGEVCRDAPMLLIGEGTAEIQKMITGRALVRDYGSLFSQATLRASRKLP